MDEAERLAWGAKEHRARMADIAAVKRGEITLATAQQLARRQSRLSGMTPTQSYAAMIDGSRVSQQHSAQGE